MKKKRFLPDKSSIISCVYLFKPFLKGLLEDLLVIKRWIKEEWNEKEMNSTGKKNRNYDYKLHPMSCTAVTFMAQQINSLKPNDNSSLKPMLCSCSRNVCMLDYRPFHWKRKSRSTRFHSFILWFLFLFPNVFSLYNRLNPHPGNACWRWVQSWKQNESDATSRWIPKWPSRKRRKMLLPWSPAVPR